MAEIKTRDGIINILKTRWINSDPLIVSVADAVLPKIMERAAQITVFSWEI